MKKLATLLIAILCSVPSLSQAQTPLDSLTLKDIFHEPYIPGNRPSVAGFSKDGKKVYIRWQSPEDSRNTMYQVDLNGKNFEKAPDGIITNYTESPDGKNLVVQRRGDLVIMDSNFENERTLVASKGFDYGATFNADGSQLAYVADGDIWITGIGEGYLKQVTARDEEVPGYNISGWAGDDKIVVSQFDNSESREYYFPESVGTYVETGASTRGVGTQIVSIVDVASGKVTELSRTKGWGGMSISPSGKYGYTESIDPEMKSRTITVYDFANDTSWVVFEDSTEGWMYGTASEFLPTQDKIMIQSERDGWNHIYTMNIDGSEFTQHTTGSYDIPFAEFIDDKTMVIATSANDPGDIQLYKLELSNNKQTALTSAEGHRRSFRLGPNNRYVAYLKTYFNEPADVYVADIRKPGSEVKLTNSVPEGFADMGWQKEDYVKITSRDGETPLSASILKPDVIDEENGNPVVVFVHGAGSLQNVFKGWSFSYWREYMFNQFLTKQGYYVLEVDYRHSTGYGRKFREDVTNWMGKYETEDIEDGLAYLADNYANVDTSNVGIYGGSYGGFMALYAVSVAPEHFDAAAALRAVTNWENYYYTNPWYTGPRLGTPEADSANYARSSPLTYADDLTKPVLILHGLIDNNVGFQDAAQYIERLIQSGNEDFDMMMYPSERHSFTDPDSWYDEYRRIFEFFEEKLKH